MIGRENHILESQQLVVDRYGLNYSLEISASNNVFCIKVSNNEGPIGTAKGTIDKDRMRLGDIEVRDPPRTTLSRWLKTLFGNVPRSYKRRGVGSILLSKAIETAKTMELSYIYGSVVSGDVENNPSLLQWYQKHGFEIQAPTDEEFRGSVARIFLNLGREQES